MNCCNHLRRLVRLLPLCLAAVASAGSGPAGDRLAAKDPSQETTARSSTGAVRLTHDSRSKRDPVFIKAGNELVYGVDESPVQIRLMRLTMADRSVVPLHKDITRSELEPAFSPNGRYCAFTQNTGNLSMRLVIRDLQQDQEAEVTHPGRGGTRSPAFSPDNKRVLYSFAEDGRQQIYSVNVRGTDKRELTDSVGINNWPTFSSDGKTIVFGSTRDGNYEIYAMNADGSNVRRLSNSPTQDIRPKISPNGKRIAFTSSRDGNREIYVMNVDGTGVKRLTRNPERDDYPAWYPDGNRLVFVSERQGRHDLYLIDVPR